MPASSFLHFELGIKGATNFIRRPIGAVGEFVIAAHSFMFSTIHLRFARQHRWFAVLGVALVLMLTALAVRPDLHEALCRHHATSAQHDPGADEDDINCVVTHFANGHLLASFCLLLLVIGFVRASEVLLRENRRVCLSVPHQLPPGCGPPSV